MFVGFFCLAERRRISWEDSSVSLIPLPPHDFSLESGGWGLAHVNGQTHSGRVSGSLSVCCTPRLAVWVAGNPPRLFKCAHLCVSLPAS